MDNYSAKVHSSDARFNDMTISLRTSIEVHPNTRLNSIEAMDEDATDIEALWYNKVVRNNVKKEK